MQIKKWTVRFLVTIGALSVLGGLAAGGVVAYRMRHAHPHLPPQFVLQVAFPDHFAEMANSDPLALVVDGPPQPTFADFLLSLSAAAEDPRVMGIAADLSRTTVGMAQAQELREVLKQFSNNGKFTYAFADSYGGIEGGNNLYYLASAFDEIWLQPTGSVGLTGLGVEVPFFRGLFDKIGIQPQFAKRYEYKSAPDSFTETAMGDAQREETVRLLGDLNQQLLQGVADDRGLELVDLQTALVRAPFAATEAVELRLVDHIGYRSDVLEQAQTTAVEEGEDGGDQASIPITPRPRHWPLVPLDAYAPLPSKSPHHSKDAPIIAVIPAAGMILRSADAGGIPGNTDEVSGADHLEALLGAAAENPAVAAIVLRVDSPGGDIVAADTIWHALAEAKKSKPVVVSMGNYAASGGYYLALPASRILANAGTITGSIGVFGGKFAISELLNKLGVTVEQVKIGANALAASMARPFGEEDGALFDRGIDAAYADFAGRVASARHFDAAKLDRVARGRVWTGQQAVDEQLVDAQGGLLTALDAARELAKIPNDVAVDVRVYPETKAPLEIILEFLSGEYPQAQLGLGQMVAAQQLGAAGLTGWIQVLTTATPHAVLPPMRLH
jgi:protease-4